MAKVFFKHPEDGAMTEGRLIRIKTYGDGTEDRIIKYYVGSTASEFLVFEVFSNQKCDSISDSITVPPTVWICRFVVFSDGHYEKKKTTESEYAVDEHGRPTALKYRDEDGHFYNADDVFDSFEVMSAHRRVWHRDEDGNKIWSDGWIEDLNTFDADQMQIIERFKKAVDEMRDAGIKLVLDQWGDDAWFVNEGRLKERGLSLEWSYEYPDCLYRIGNENYAFRQKCSIGRLMIDDGDCKVYIINKDK